MKQNSFEQNTLTELKKYEKSTKNLIVLFAIFFIIAVGALIYGAITRGMSTNGTLYFPPVLILVFISINYQNLQKVRKEIESRNLNQQ